MRLLETEEDARKQSDEPKQTYVRQYGNDAVHRLGGRRPARATGHALTPRALHRGTPFAARRAAWRHPHFSATVSSPLQSNIAAGEMTSSSRGRRGPKRSRI